MILLKVVSGLRNKAHNTGFFIFQIWKVLCSTVLQSAHSELSMTGQLAGPTGPNVEICAHFTE